MAKTVSLLNDLSGTKASSNFDLMKQLRYLHDIQYITCDLEHTGYDPNNRKSYTLILPYVFLTTLSGLHTMLLQLIIPSQESNQEG